MYAIRSYYVVRVSVRRGGLRKQRPQHSKKPSTLGVNKITMAKSIQRIAEERAVITSYSIHYTKLYETLTKYQTPQMWHLKLLKKTFIHS